MLEAQEEDIGRATLDSVKRGRELMTFIWGCMRGCPGAHCCWRGSGDEHDGGGGLPRVSLGG